MFCKRISSSSSNSLRPCHRPPHHENFKKFLFKYFVRNLYEFIRQFSEFVRRCYLTYIENTEEGSETYVSGPPNINKLVLFFEFSKIQELNLYEFVRPFPKFLLHPLS
jgi:hypothetical protein